MPLPVAGLRQVTEALSHGHEQREEALGTLSDSQVVLAILAQGLPRPF